MPINIIQNIEKGVLPNTATTQLFLMDVEKFLDALPMQAYLKINGIWVIP